MASLVNMETSKVNDYEYTVFTAIKGMFRKNPYMPREVRDYKEGQQEIDWEKADLCPVAMAEAMVYHHIDDEEKKIRKWAERPLKKMKKEERADGIVPRESVEQDEELCREINERIKE